MLACSFNSGLIDYPEESTAWKGLAEWQGL